MSGSFKKIFQDKIIFWSFTASLSLITIYLFLAILFYRFLPPFIPLFNQLPWGEERLALRIEVFIPVIVVLLISIFNVFIAKNLYEKIPLLSRILSVTGILVTLFAFIFILKTILLVF